MIINKSIITVDKFKKGFVMSYKIVVDSCCDLSEDMKKWDNLEVVPLTLQINDYSILDDENFDQDDFIERMKANGGLAKSACPSPEAF